MELDFASLRQWMVEEQIMARGILQRDVVASMRKVPRHLFVPPELQHMAYDDGPLPIGEEQVISQPYLVASMTQAAEVSSHSQVLEIGTGSGYQAAILGEIAQQVYTIERISSLAEKAKIVLRDLGYQNVHVIVADGTQGLSEHSLYDAIVVTAASSSVPKALEDQLAEGGRLVIPIGNLTSQRLMRYRKVKGQMQPDTVLERVRFVPLIG